jgi:S-adenosylmethionine/arginine decarboxylase-like enzyme
MKNVHFVGEWFECRASGSVLADPQAIHALCREKIASRHLPISYQYFTQASDGGVIGAIVGKDIHFVLRTFPQDNSVIADLHVCRSDASDVSSAMRVFDDLRDEFRPMRALLHRVLPHGQRPSSRSRTPRAPTEVLVSMPARHAG